MKQKNTINKQHRVKIIDGAWKGEFGYITGPRNEAGANPITLDSGFQLAWFDHEILRGIGPATSWAEVPALVDARPAVYETTAYGISRSMCGNEVYVDCGDELGGLMVVTLKFRDRKAANVAYCMGIRVAVKVVEHPEHELE